MRISDWSSDGCSSDLIGVTVTTTTAEAATEAGPNGPSGEECDDSDNIDVDSYDFTVTVNPTVTPPTVDVDLVGDKACIKEDGSVTFDIVVSAAGGTDDVVNTVTFDQFAALQPAGRTRAISAHRSEERRVGNRGE